MFLRRQNAVARVSSCLGFTPHPYGEYPSSPLSPFLRGSEGLRLVHAGGGSAGAPLPGLEQRGPGMLIPGRCRAAPILWSRSQERLPGFWQPAREMLAVPPQCWRVEQIPVSCFSLSPSGMQRSGSGKRSNTPCAGVLRPVHGLTCAAKALFWSVWSCLLHQPHCPNHS